MGPIGGQYGALYGPNMGIPHGPRTDVSVGETRGLCGILHGALMGPIWGNKYTDKVIFWVHVGLMWGPPGTYMGYYMGPIWGIYGIMLHSLGSTWGLYGKCMWCLMAMRGLCGAHVGEGWGT